MAVYHRVVLKLSGEALKSDKELFDFEKVNQAAGIIRRMHDMGTEIGIVIGAGNIWRGRQGPSANMDAVTADQMGMLGTVINCLCVADALRKAGLNPSVRWRPGGTCQKAGWCSLPAERGILSSPRIRAWRSGRWRWKRTPC